MSIDLPTGAFPPSTNGELQSAPLTPLTDEFEKMKSTVGFVEPLTTSQLLEHRMDIDDESYNEMIQKYIAACLAEQNLPQHERSDVYAYRGILLAVAQQYYEREFVRGNRHNDVDRARNYNYKEYVRTVHDDMRMLGEPENEHMDALLLGTGVRDPRLPDPRLIVFNTNVMRVLGKIDHNVAPLYADQMNSK